MTVVYMNIFVFMLLLSRLVFIHAWLQNKISDWIVIWTLECALGLCQNNSFESFISHNYVGHVLNHSCTGNKFTFSQIRKEQRIWSRNNILSLKWRGNVYAWWQGSNFSTKCLMLKSNRTEKSIQTTWWVLICWGWYFRCIFSSMCFNF